jgi:hypothetical protein
MNAFHNDAAIKAELLQSLDRNDTLPMPSAANPAELIAWADEVGIPQALALLMTHLAHGEGAAAKAFVRDFLTIIEPGADTKPIAHRWVQWAWNDAPEPLKSFVDDPALLAAGNDAVALHVRVANGETLDRSTWRSTRSKLNAFTALAGDAGAAAAVLAASSWDYETVPGAASDMASSWEKMDMSRIRFAENWGEEQDARVQQIIIEEREKAEVKLGLAAGEEPDATARHRELLVKEMLAAMDRLDEPLLRRNADMRERIVAAFERLRCDGRQALLSLLAPPTTVHR